MTSMNNDRHLSNEDIEALVRAIDSGKTDTVTTPYVGALLGDGVEDIIGGLDRLAEGIRESDMY